jgi:hypothetical protein
MSGYVRRIVTGHDASGKAIVVSDAAAPTVHSNPLRPGHFSFGEFDADLAAQFGAHP